MDFDFLFVFAISADEADSEFSPESFGRYGCFGMLRFGSYRSCRSFPRRDEIPPLPT